MNEDDSFDGTCPTCGQPYLQARVRELEARMARVVALVQPVSDEHAHRTEDTSLVLSELADKILEALA